MAAALWRRRARQRKKDAFRGVVELTGNSSFTLDVVGESNYQVDLSRICGGKTWDGHRLKTRAALIPEDENPHDPLAIRVDIAQRTVGYLSRADARRFRKFLAGKGFPEGLPSICDAIIVGGWDRGPKGSGHFGVKLDLPL